MTNVRGAPSRSRTGKTASERGAAIFLGLSRHAIGGQLPAINRVVWRKKIKKRKRKKRASSPGSWSGSREPTVLGIARYPPRGFCFAPTSSRPYSEFQEVRGRGEWRKGGEKDGINSFDG